MGNRAVVSFNKEKTYNPNSVGVYFHWNGGRDSIESMLKATREIMGSRLGDAAYGMSRFVQAATTALPGNLSIGLGICETMDTDNYDNGTYIVNPETMEIIGREFFTGTEQNEYDVDEFSTDIVAGINASAAAMEK